MVAFLVVVKQVAYRDVGVPCPWNLVACPLEASCQAVVGLHSVVGAFQGRKAVEALDLPWSGQGAPLNLVASC